MWKFYGNCAYPQNFHARKLGEITVFYAVEALCSVFLLSLHQKPYFSFILFGKDGLSKRFTLKYLKFPLLLGKMEFLFPKNIISLFGRKLKDDLPKNVY